MATYSFDPILFTEKVVFAPIGRMVNIPKSWVRPLEEVLLPLSAREFRASCRPGLLAPMLPPPAWLNAQRFDGQVPKEFPNNWYTVPDVGTLPLEVPQGKPLTFARLASHGLQYQSNVSQCMGNGSQPLGKVAKWARYEFGQNLELFMTSLERLGNEVEGKNEDLVSQSENEDSQSSTFTSTEGSQTSTFADESSSPASIVAVPTPSRRGSRPQPAWTKSSTLVRSADALKDQARQGCDGVYSTLGEEPLKPTKKKRKVHHCCWEELYYC